MLPAPTYHSPRLADVRLPARRAAASPLRHLLRPSSVASSGRSAPVWFDYVTDDVVGHTKFREWTGNLTLDGPLFRLPGGDAQAVVGFEYRKSSINDMPSDDCIRGNLLQFHDLPITKGSDSVWEAFTELEFPILQNVPFAEALTSMRRAATRIISHTVRTRPTRSAVSTRRPAGSRSAAATVPRTVRRPCSSSSWARPAGSSRADDRPLQQSVRRHQPDDHQANCLADGLPTTSSNNGGVNVLQRGGADAGLEAETSKNLTFGFVFSRRLARHSAICRLRSIISVSRSTTVSVSLR